MVMIGVVCNGVKKGRACEAAIIVVVGLIVINNYCKK